MKQEMLDFDGPRLTNEQSAVWNCIRDQRGKGSEILGTRIAERTGIQYDHVRTVIGDLRRHKRKLIASNSRGYYIPTTKEELYEYTASLRSRALVILWTVSVQTGVSLEEIFNQGRLEMNETRNANRGSRSGRTINE